MKLLESCMRDFCLDNGVGCNEKNLAEFREIAPSNSRLLFTGIGGAVASSEGAPLVRVHKDKSQLPVYLDLKETFGQVPELLFLAASPTTMDNLAGLVELAKNYKLFLFVSHIQLSVE